MLPTLKTHLAYPETFTDIDSKGKFISRCRYYDGKGKIVFEKKISSNTKEEAKKAALKVLTTYAKNVPEKPKKAKKSKQESEVVSISKDDVGELNLDSDDGE